MGVGRAAVLHLKGSHGRDGGSHATQRAQPSTILMIIIFLTVFFWTDWNQGGVDPRSRWRRTVGWQFWLMCSTRTADEVCCVDYTLLLPLQTCDRHDKPHDARQVLGW